MVFRRWMQVLAACLLLLAVLAGYKYWQIRQLIAFAESFPEASETVEVFTVSPQTWQETTRTVGDVLAPQTVELRNEVEGRVVAVGFAAGEPVKKDQMLLQLDASEEIAQLRGAQADANLAQQALSRYEKLIEKNVSSREQYDQARAQFAIATARAQTLQAVIDKKTLTAPFDANTGLHTLHAGQYLAADTVITQLVGNQQTLWVDFALPQQLSGISKGASVSITARGVLTTPVTGHIIAIEPALSQQSRNSKLRATIDNSITDNSITNTPSAAVKPGMLVDVEVAIAPVQTVFAVPATAVQYSKEGTYVFVIQTDNKQQQTDNKQPQSTEQQRARKRPVTVSSEKGGRMVISSGLQAGDVIAANGAYKLQDGMIAKIKQPAITPVEKSSP